MPRRTVLIIDDNSDERELALRAIARVGLDVDVVCASDGDEALKLLGVDEGVRALPIRPAVVLLDIKMPKMTGLEVLHRIRTSRQLKRVPVVMMTSSDEPKDIERCYAEGANSYTVKPIDFIEYMEQLCEIIQYWTLLNRSPATDTVPLF